MGRDGGRRCGLLIFKPGADGLSVHPCGDRVSVVCASCAAGACEQHATMVQGRWLCDECRIAEQQRTLFQLGHRFAERSVGCQQQAAHSGTCPRYAEFACVVCDKPVCLEHLLFSRYPNAVLQAPQGGASEPIPLVNLCSTCAQVEAELQISALRISQGLRKEMLYRIEPTFVGTYERNLLGQE